jgi:hypothetical protein
MRLSGVMRRIRTEPCLDLTSFCFIFVISTLDFSLFAPVDSLASAYFCLMCESICGPIRLLCRVLSGLLNLMLFRELASQDGVKA